MCYSMGFPQARLEFLTRFSRFAVVHIRAVYVSGMTYTSCEVTATIFPAEIKIYVARKLFKCNSSTFFVKFVQRSGRSVPGS